MNNYILALLMIVISIGLAAKTDAYAKPVTTVDSVDLSRYLGLWHQIAYFPNSFQPKDYPTVTAEYSLGKKGKIKVINTCYKRTGDKLLKKKAIGKAYAVDASNAKLKVSFFWPFKGDYWIVKLDKVNYSYSVVSDPSREYLWILCRSNTLKTSTYEEITDWLQTNGWDLSRLVFTGNLY